MKIIIFLKWYFKKTKKIWLTIIITIIAISLWVFICKLIGIYLFKLTWTRDSAIFWVFLIVLLGCLFPYLIIGGSIEMRRWIKRNKKEIVRYREIYLTKKDEQKIKKQKIKKQNGQISKAEKTEEGKLSICQGKII